MRTVALVPTAGDHAVLLTIRLCFLLFVKGDGPRQPEHENGVFRVQEVAPA